MRKPRGMPSAIKHGAYRGKLLPGEDPAKFEKLHRDVIAEICPSGALEEDIVKMVANLLWRKNNLPTVQAAGRAWNRYNRIESRLREEMNQKIMRYTTVSSEFDPEQERELRRAVNDEARAELGDDYKFIEAGDDQTLAAIMDDFELEARIDEMIDVCIKRLLHLRGLKSLSLSSSTSSAALLPSPADKKAA